MDCIKELIGIKGACDNPEEVKFYLDHFGVSLKTAAETADEKFTTGKNLVNSKIDMAIQDVFDDITAEGFELLDVASSFSLGSHGANLLDPFSETRTITIKAAASCKTVRPFITMLSVCGQGDAVIKVDGVEVFNGTVDGQEDLNFYDYGSVIEITGDEFSPCSGSSGLACQCKCTTRRGHSHLHWKSSNGLMNGLMIGLQARCDKELLLCQYREFIAKAVVYKTVAMILFEMVQTQRYNDTIIYNQEKAKTLAAFYDSEYNIFAYNDGMVSTEGKPKVKEGKYQRELVKLNQTIKVPEDHCCSVCDKSHYNISKP